MLSAEVIAERVREMGREITRDYSTSCPVLIAVLKGALVMLADLSRAIETPHEIDFLTVSSYGSATQSSGTVAIHHDVRTDIRGRDVIVVEGVVDTGLTLTVIMDHLKRHGTRSVRVATLLDKVPCRKVPVDLHYVGFRIGEEFVVGYGMDYAGFLRNLPHIAVIEDAGEAAVHETAACDPDVPRPEA
jgi:hypoxanthine phosphoribosyltransferase